MHLPHIHYPKYITKLLSPLQNNKYIVKNSAFFLEKILTLSVDPDEILEYFDVVPRFTCIRNTQPWKLLKRRQRENQLVHPKYQDTSTVRPRQQFLCIPRHPFPTNCFRLSDGIPSQRHLRSISSWNKSKKRFSKGPPTLPNGDLDT